MKTERRGAARFFTELASIELLTMSEQRTLLASVEGSPAVVISVETAIQSLAGNPQSEALVAKLRALPPGTHLLALT